MDGKKQANPHEGHRQRMKERFLRDGMESFSGHEVLEMLLYYAVPYKDTNGLGHTLEDAFGGLSNVLDADYNDLLKVPGVTPHIATLITFAGQLSRRYLKERHAVGTLLYSVDQLGSLVVPLFVGRR